MEEDDGLEVLPVAVAVGHLLDRLDLGERYGQPPTRWLVRGGPGAKRQLPPLIGPRRSIAPDGRAVTERSEGKGASDLDSPAAGATIIEVQGGGGRIAQLRLRVRSTHGKPGTTEVRRDLAYRE